jgi:hypothetical protein
MVTRNGRRIFTRPDSLAAFRLPVGPRNRPIATLRVAGTKGNGYSAARYSLTIENTLETESYQCTFQARPATPPSIINHLTPAEFDTYATALGLFRHRDATLFLEELTRVLSTVVSYGRGRDRAPPRGKKYWTPALSPYQPHGSWTYHPSPDPADASILATCTLRKPRFVPRNYRLGDHVLTDEELLNRLFPRFPANVDPAVTITYERRPRTSGTQASPTTNDPSKPF